MRKLPLPALVTFTIALMFVSWWLAFMAGYYEALVESPTVEALELRLATMAAAQWGTGSLGEVDATGRPIGAWGDWLAWVRLREK